MDPTTVFCPNGNCHARGQTGKGNIGIHSRKAQRFICHECHKTFSATPGTVFYRLRTAAETVVLIVTLLAHGCPVHAIGRRLDSTSVPERIGGPVRAVRATPCTRIWSSNRGTWDRSKPMSCASRNRAVSSGWPWR